MQRVSPEAVLHVAVCQAVGLMNGALVFAQSEEGQQVRNILRKALTEYADAYMDQPVTEAERAAMIRGHANSAVDIEAVPDELATACMYAYMAGYRSGHNRTVEGCYSSDEEVAASEWWEDEGDFVKKTIAPQPPAPAVSPVDIQAVREVIAYLRHFADHDSADQLARAIGDEK